MARRPPPLGPLECGIGVWREDDGSHRYDLAECPISTLARYRAEVGTAAHWRLLGQFPYELSETDTAFWQATSAVYSEGQWFANQPKPKDTIT